MVWRGDAAPAKMQLETLKTPTPKEKEVLVKVRACGVCHTDLHVIKGEVPFPNPAVLGHEVSGVIVGVGPGVDNSLLGEKVVCPFIMPCMECSFCKAGEEDTCEPFFALNRLKGQLYDGTTRLATTSGEEVAMYSMGGMAEYCVVPTTGVFRLPKGLQTTQYPESSILGCMFFTAYGAVHNAGNLRKGETVAVIGCGGIGSALLQIAKAEGASQIIAIDIAKDKLEAAEKLGATHIIDASTGVDVPARIAELTNGRKVDVCFEALGNKRTFEQATLSVRDGGRAVFVGIADVRSKAEVPITHVVRRRVSLIGSYGARASQDVPRMLDLAEAGQLDIQSPISRRFRLEEAGEAFHLLNEGKILGRAIVEVES